MGIFDFVKNVGRKLGIGDDDEAPSADPEFTPLRRVNSKRGIGACPRRSTTDVVSCAHTRPTRRAIR